MFNRSKPCGTQIKLHNFNKLVFCCFGNLTDKLTDELAKHWSKINDITQEYPDNGGEQGLCCACVHFI